KGVGHHVGNERMESGLGQRVAIRGRETLEKHEVSYDLLVHARHLEHVKTVAEACPELRLVVDHVAKPPISSGELAEWADALREVAVYTNVSCKLSGFVTESKLTSWRET